MPLTKACFLVILIHCLLPGIISAQPLQADTSLAVRAEAILQKQTTQHPVEKVYLHLDKYTYAPGESIWFKAYVTQGDLHLPSNISNVLYVELIHDASQRVVQTCKLYLTAGLAHGDLALIDTLQTGGYHLRAYTNWMRNNDNAYFYKQALTIEKSSAKGPLLTNTTLAQGPGIQFFPEGGKLINNVRCRIGFKASGYGDLNKPVSGTITDDSGTELTRFTSRSLGIGVFTLRPLPGKTYKANILYADGSRQTVNLPTAVTNGYALSISPNNVDSNMVVRISSGYTDTATRNLTLIAQSGSLLCYAAQIHLSGKIAIVSIPQKRFPTGTALFTLFTPGDELVNERMFFINHHDNLRVSVASLQNAHQPRKKTDLLLNVKDADGKPVEGSFSANVINENLLAADSAFGNNILNHLLLTSDLRNQVELPDYDLSTSDSTQQANLDALMLTQELPRFNWREALNRSGRETTPSSFYPPEHGLQVTGQVTTLNGEPVPGGKVTLLNTAQALSIDTVTDKDGHFAFHNLIYPDSTHLLLQAYTPTGSDQVKLTVDEVDSSLPKPYSATSAGNNSVPPTTSSAGSAPGQKQQTSYTDDSHAVKLKEVQVKAKRDKREDASPFSSNLNGRGRADMIITGEELERQGGDLANILQGKISNTRVVNGNVYSIANGGGPMAVVLDGMMMTTTTNNNPRLGLMSISALNQINPSDVESIEVLKSPSYLSIYGVNAASGILVITTKHSKAVSAGKSPNIKQITVNGFYKARKFYSPDYSKPAQLNSKTPDHRTTIQWIPDIVTNKDGKASINFFNADDKGTYRVTIEGINANGSLAHEVYRIKIE